MVCRLQGRLQIIALTLGSKVKVGIKGQCQIYLESVLLLITHTALVFLTVVLPILYNED